MPVMNEIEDGKLCSLFIWSFTLRNLSIVGGLLVAYNDMTMLAIIS